MTTENPLFAELVRVHDLLRRDLAALRAIAVDDRPADAIRADLRDLHTRGPLFQLQANCLGYCQLVHRHHGGESELLFPVLRRTAPQLAATLDRLDADHRVVADLLDDVEAVARALGDDTAARRRLTKALDALADHLHEHLTFEERALEPVLARWRHWPGVG